MHGRVGRTADVVNPASVARLSANLGFAGFTGILTGIMNDASIALVDVASLFGPGHFDTSDSG